MTDTATVDDVAAANNEVTRLQKSRNQKVGRVVSDKMDKSVVVAVDYVKRHPLYHKRITRTSKFMAHDEHNNCHPGDIVRIEETRPLSKRKRWIVREVVERAVNI
ncbi:MAG: 30S ribosomal protein S17 [Thermomicrobiales bacterium]|jgi:small subunit ribosomal protein S17